VNQQGKVLDTDITPWYEKYVSPKYDPKEVKLEPNKLTRDDGWSLNIQRIVFGQSFPYDPTLKNASISFTIQNNTGDDQIFMPKGSIVGITSTGGKTYPISFGSLELLHIRIQELRIEQKQTDIKPGLLKLSSDISVDGAETRFSKVTYRDEQGNEFEIPVDMTPGIITQPKNAVDTTVLMEKYLKDHGYTILTATGGGNLAGASIQLPKSFNEVVSGVEIGELLRQKNELSKKKNLDFSKYLGEKVSVMTWGLEGLANNPNGLNAFFLIHEDQIVGVWFESNTGSGEKNTTLTILENTL
jgi:hypothetical protein